MSQLGEGRENSIKRKKLTKNLLIVGTVIAIIGSFFAGNIFAKYGYVMGPNGAEYSKVMKNIKDVDKYSALFEVREDLNRLYDGELDDNAMLEGAIKGMTNALKDPYTVFMNKEEYDKFMESNSGAFMGIGVYIALKDDKVTVDSPIEGGPAEAAGVKAGDVILAVDGEEIGNDQSKAVSLISGVEKKAVKLTISRGNGEVFDVDVMRDTVKTVSVKGEMIYNEVGYIRLTSFDKDVSKDFNNMLKDFKAKGMKGLILDLRGNGGGYLTEAVNIASEFIPKGKTVTYTINKYDQKDVSSSVGGIAEGTPLVILTDGLTASASEVVTGALRDYDIATTVGTTTYGKGVVQLPFEIKSGIGGLKVTISKYYTPNGENINKKGINPDYEVKLSEEDINRAYDRNSDPQFQKGLEVIKDKIK
ncbi:S41 family peptidase [Clostridium sp. LP20]|uniref:S41 family peptidase n=1 Tax=Clostridium sp. LP20 TaxID=3418665 RepID=UPI003EE80658